MAITTVPQGVIRVDVDFYDDGERDALLQYPSASSIQEIVGSSPIEIPTAEFLAYYLFHRKRLGSPRYRDYRSIGRNLHQAITDLDGCVDLGDSIHTARKVTRQLKNISEHIGEGIGLSISSRIHGLTEADWAAIEEFAGRSAPPTFDFELASNGEDFVQVENKGSSVEDNRIQNNAVKAQKRRIAKKKAKLQKLAETRDDPYPASIRYGTITVVDRRRQGNVKCWLTDPPADQVTTEPRRFRLVQRMRFLRDWIAFVSETSQLAVAISTRLADIEALEDPFELDGVRLRRGSNAKFLFGRMRTRGNHSTFFWTKSRVLDDRSGGVVLQLSNSEMFFAGIREDFITLSAKQDFENILTYRANTGSLEKTVECVFSESRYESLSLPGSVHERARRSANYFSFDLDGVLHYSPAGLVFGVLRLPAK
jgi:hypothetical protein